MEYVIVILIIVAAVQEFRIHRLYERLMLQANIPTLGPVRVAGPTLAPVSTEVEKPASRRKAFSLRIPS